MKKIPQTWKVSDHLYVDARRPFIFAVSFQSIPIYPIAKETLKITVYILQKNLFT